MADLGMQFLRLAFAGALGDPSLAGEHLSQPFDRLFSSHRDQRLIDAVLRRQLRRGQLTLQRRLSRETNREPLPLASHGFRHS